MVLVLRDYQTEATAKIMNGKSITTAYRNTLNGHVRRFGEFIKHQFD